MTSLFSSLLLTGTLLSATTLAAAQSFVAPTSTAKNAGTVAGTVADSASRAALPFATVVLRQGPDPKNVLSTITDERGAFSFSGVATGQYALEVRYLGYQAAQPVAVTIAATGTNAPVQLTLVPE
ncbi:MAG: carboxypeptidase-like regulatory domain-containing protein, partial [Hymenobacter sp.]